MKLTDLKAQIWRLVLFPALGATVILAAVLTYLYLDQLDQFVAQRGSALSERLADVSREILDRDDPELLSTVIEASLEEPYIRAIGVHLKASGEAVHSGPRMRPLSQPEPIDLSRAQQRETPKSIRFAHPIPPATEGGSSPGWVEVELLTSPLLVLRYQTLLITLLLSAASLALSGFLATRLYRQLNHPLREIKDVIHQMARGQMDQRLPNFNNREIDDLAQAVNATAESLEQAHRDMQIHINQSTEDLRETLETIEIQNIELNMARKEALEASRVKSEFLANTSHEIRTPLNGILGFTNLALKTDLDEQQKEYLETIRDSSQNLLAVINDILDFSKIESGKLTLDYVPLPLRRVVEEAAHILAPLAHEKHLQLIARVDDNLPLNLLGDPLRFKQVVTNLVSNAIKFSQHGNIVVHVELLTRQETQLTLKVSVSDNGIGLTQEHKERLFSAFNQADTSSSREYSGTGLGLVICKGLVERMGGDIGVESQIEQGSRFWFTARLGIDKSLPDSPPECLLLGQRVLICSDNPPSGQQLEHLLGQWQAEPELLEHVHDIFPRLRQAKEGEEESFSLLLLDISPDARTIQPHILESLNRQLQEEFDCKLIACCTPAHQRLFRREAELSTTVFINKPISYDALLEVLARQMDIPLRRKLPQGSQRRGGEGRPAARILVVDDNPANLQLASELLRGLNTSVIAANNGREALELCQKHTFDLIFMDIQMPGMDGIETTRRLRQDHSGPRTPIVALTAHSMTEQKSELLIAGMDDCVSKPVSEAQLAHIINRWVHLSGRKSVEGSMPDTPTQPRLPAIELAADEQPSPVDIPLCLKLANNKPTLARDMLTMLLQNLSAERDAINAALEAAHFEELEQLVHRLYGSCCYCGVPRLKRISGLLDKILQARQYDQLQSPVTALNNEVDEILSWGYKRDIDGLFQIDP